MQLHTILLGVNTVIMQFCVFTGSGSPTDEWHHEIDSKGNKVIRVEFEVSRMCGLEEFNEAIKIAEQEATEEYRKHCALYGPMSVDLTGHAFDLEEFGKFSREATAKMEQPPGQVHDYEANVSAIKDYFDFVRSTEEKFVVTPQGAFTSKEGVTIPLNNAEVKVALGQYIPTAAENKAAEDFFKRHGVRPYAKNSAEERLDAEAMQEVMAHDQEIDKAVSKIAAAYPRAFGIVKQPLTPEQKADMDKYYEILAQQAKEAVGMILSVDNLSQLGLPRGPENATDAKQRLDAIAVGPVRLNTSDPAYTLFSTDTGRMAASAVSYDKNAKLPTSDPQAVDAMIEKRTKMAEALRKQGVEFVSNEFKPIDNPNIEALKQRVRVAKRSWDVAVAEDVNDANYFIERYRCYNEFLKACIALRQAGVPVSDAL